MITQTPAYGKVVPPNGKPKRNSLRMFRSYTVCRGQWETVLPEKPGLQIDLEQMTQECGFLHVMESDPGAPVAFELYCDPGGTFAIVLKFGARWTWIEVADLPSLLTVFKELEPLMKFGG